MTSASRPERAQPAEPSHLLDAVTDRLGAGVAVAADPDLAMVELAVRGQWSPSLAEQTSAALRLCLAGPSTSIIVDLSDLGDPDGVSVSHRLMLWRRARLGTAPVRMTFCLPRATVFSRRVRFLQGPQPQVFASVLEARTAIGRRTPQADRLHARLDPHPGSVKSARDLVVQACHAWRLPALLSDARLIVSELAANAVEHAGTDFIVTVSRGGVRIHVSVHDRVGGFPHPDERELVVPQASLDERGRGLRLVHTTAVVWGALPTRDGKVVWATVAASS